MTEIEFNKNNILNVLLAPGTYLKDPDCIRYISNLGNVGLEVLCYEPERLKEEHKSLLQKKQELAFSNYKTYIQTAECSREIGNKFLTTETNLDIVIKELPKLNVRCHELRVIGSEVDGKRRLNSLVLSKHNDLLRLLELPQLMDNWIKNRKFEEALELASYVKWLGKKYGSIVLIQSIVKDFEDSWEAMLHQLVAQMRYDLQLPECLEVVGYVRRMEVFSDAELRLKFLQTRDVWFQNLLSAIPRLDGYQYILKVIELTRMQLFKIITQYRAIFSDEEPVVPSSKNLSVNEATIFYSWLNEKDYITSKLLWFKNKNFKMVELIKYFCPEVEIILSVLKGFLIEMFNRTAKFCDDLQYFPALRDVSYNITKVFQFISILDDPEITKSITSLDSLMVESMNFGQSFSRVGTDFRGLIAYKFIRIIEQNFEYAVRKVSKKFELEMEKFVISKTSPKEKFRENLELKPEQPPNCLVQFYPLASYTNGLLTAFNDLRECAPLSVADSVTNTIQDSLKFCSKIILQYYKQEQAFDSVEKEKFSTFCGCFHILVNYIQKCIHAIFPLDSIAHHLGIPVHQLQKEGLTFLDVSVILDPLGHLIPDLISNPAPF